MQEMTNMARIAINVMIDFDKVRRLNHFEAFQSQVSPCKPYTKAQAQGDKIPKGLNSYPHNPMISIRQAKPASETDTTILSIVSMI